MRFVEFGTIQIGQSWDGDGLGFAADLVCSFLSHLVRLVASRGLLFKDWFQKVWGH